MFQENNIGWKTKLIVILIGVSSYLAAKGIDSLTAGTNRGYLNTERIIKLETNYENIMKTLGEIKQELKKP